MRPVVLATLALAAVLLAVPTVGASCHYCFLPEPITAILRDALP